MSFGSASSKKNMRMRLRVRSINFKDFKNLSPLSKIRSRSKLSGVNFFRRPESNRPTIWSHFFTFLFSFPFELTTTNRSSGRFGRKIFFGLLTVALLAPAPYVIITPGEPENVLEKTIKISGATTYPTSGKLSLTSVLVSNPDVYLPGAAILWVWARGNEAVLPRIDIYGDGETSADAIAAGQSQMRDSQANATQAALNYLGYKGESKILVGTINPLSNAKGVLQTGDQLISIDDQIVSSADQIAKIVASKKPNDLIKIKFINKAGDSIEQSIKLISRPDKSAFIGITLENNVSYPVKVSVDIENTGGPSGGLIFAVGIIEKLTPENFVNGRNIAGTGTITPSGEVGPIGGIMEKIAGAKAAGVKIFLAPAENCIDIYDVPAGITIAPVKSLTEALDVLRQSQNSGYKFPTCDR